RSTLPGLLGWIIEGVIASGRFAAAVADREEALERAHDSAAEHPWTSGFHALALAMVGRLNEARTVAERVMGMAQTDPAIGADRSPALLALGVVARAQDRFDEAVSHLRALGDIKRQAGIRDPRSCAHAGELVEALIGAGRLEGATEELAGFEADAERASATSSLAIAARGRALLSAARGEL